MSVESYGNEQGTAAGSGFPRKRTEENGWSSNISDQSYKKLVTFLKKRRTIPLTSTGDRLYHVNRDRPQTCWDDDSMSEHIHEQDSSDKGWWFHVDGNIDEQQPSTFRVKKGTSLALLDLTFVGRHAELWERIVATANEAPDLLGAGVNETPEGIQRYIKIDKLTTAIGDGITGKDALYLELENMNIFSNSDKSRWFWQAMREIGADGYVSYDHEEARKVDTLSPGLLQRPFLPPIVDRFGHPEDAMVLASDTKSVDDLSNEWIVKSIITFPQVVLTAQGAQKLDWIDHLPASERECEERRVHGHGKRVPLLRSKQRQTQEDETDGDSSRGNCVIS